MALSLQVSNLLSYSSSSSSSKGGVSAAIHVPKIPGVRFSVQKLSTGRKHLEELKGTNTITLEKNDTTTHVSERDVESSKISKARRQMYDILEAVADRVEMHKNIGEQRDHWNSLLLNSINMMTLTATTMACVAVVVGAEGSSSLLALKLSSGLLFSGATGMLLVMNKIQPSQLAEEQRNATRLFKQLQTQIQTNIALNNPTEQDVKHTMEKVLALDKAYPLPLLGAMLDKFPEKFQPATWWPSTRFQRKLSKHEKKIISRKTVNNGWSEELELELREVVEVIRRKDIEDYERLGNLALNINRILSISGPLLTGIASVGSAFVGHGSWTDVVPLMAGALATAVNAFEHGGQVGMVFEMYRNCAGFFNLLETSIEATLEETDVDRREHGELLEMQVALKLGRSLSQVRELARKSATSRIEGVAVDEFASKLF